ncbi:unnamed protein product [Strongylus vulgaris]|uniref:L-Fucosyltransferase n=1 Tax=Strongylus vulgaris TaxID=40348 RepID=A0A3P7JJM5_STRVU|nr:unnamed protein product [Strongylus vulgaris]
MSCCEYEDPTRLQTSTEQFLVLEIHYAQNVRYFEPILPEIRYLLELSDDVKQAGDEVLQRWKIGHAGAMCAHIRRSDFITLRLATTLRDSVQKIQHIAALSNLTEYVIFGDDVDFMKSMQERMHPKKVHYSIYSEGVDFHIASNVCQAMLITAPTSTFGWWLAFFSPNQNSIYYNSDPSNMSDKFPNKDLYLSSWKNYSELERWT